MKKYSGNIPMKSIGQFTKNAVENFEENIVNEKNYLEKSGSVKGEYKK